MLYYRAQQLAGNTAYVEALCDAIDAAGGTALPVYCTSLRNPEPELLDVLSTADAMVVTVLAAGGALYLLSGFAVTAEVSFNMYFGDGGIIYPLIGGGIGLLFDYEVLP